MFVREPQRVGRGESRGSGAALRALTLQRKPEGSARDQRGDAGEVAWEVPQTGPGGARGGTLATASDVYYSTAADAGPVRRGRRIDWQAAVAVWNGAACGAHRR